MQRLHGKRVVVAMSGGVAAYKVAMLCRLLVKAGARVQVVMTEAATRFMTPVTMQALSGRAVYTDQWDARADNNMLHINLTRDADVLLLAPASADMLAKLAQGRADELVSLMCLAKPAALPLLVAPAMNREMWAHPATQRNVAQLTADGVRLLPVGEGEQACGEVGDGRMLEPEALFDYVEAALTADVLAGKKVVITAGPTFEAIDPVRGITNHSSGKMGYALARAAQQAGAQVTLVSGPVALAVPTGVTCIGVQSAQQMYDAAVQRVQVADVFIAAAAVADWRPAHAARQKIKKDRGAADGGIPTLSFVENPDILATVAQSERARSGALYCVGFAAESENIEEHAVAKRARKQVPLLVANNGPATFGKDDNKVWLVEEAGISALPLQSKQHLAAYLVELVAQRMAQ